MEEKLIEKEYSIPYEMFGEAYNDFQKKYVYPRNYTMMTIFTALGVIYFTSARRDPTNKLAFILTFVCFAFACINWFTPKRTKRSLMEGIRGIENERYKLTVYETYIEISTISSPDKEEETIIQADEDVTENPDETELFGDAPDEVIESSKLFFNKDLKIVEKNAYFMVYQVKQMFYVIPKTDFTDAEIEIMRKYVNS